MSLLVDTSVWSLAFRRDAVAVMPEVSMLRHALDGADQVFTTGLVLQELLHRARRPDDMSPLEIETVPLEVVPMVASVNRSEEHTSELQSPC